METPESKQIADHYILNSDSAFYRGYVALAVVSETDVLSRDLNTGLGSDRAGNMVAFATEALKLVAEFVKTRAGQGEKI